ncbi:MAG: cation transporter [Polynucleobacter sp. 24-46-87]|jgi:cobalt-zinc-cadmium efflux system protein|uniref:alpha/beta fold hydrolase n=1 Tax=Burkholderiales TaxID=80840 RepID=UPI000BD68B71|nr:MAG: cation transporter [Polynucleobacter sp. 35-46-11]OZA13131.1 MAG: cation transporter [Polynucleobacter sp. 24-46-87]OZA45167.1 MAG: cation transporter [Polaromonas sp. 17-63-33]OZA75193.1 MAG: cation transporter [Polynucleobacter sp. 39-46-10]
MSAADHSLHAHKQGDAKHSHAKQVSNQNLLLIALVLTLGFSGVEGAAAYFANSLALISDAGHMVTDAAALGLALLAQIISRRPPSPKHSFGFGRAEALAAFVNSIAMLALVAWIMVEAVSRFYDPHQVDGLTVTVVAAIGLLMNIVVAWVLSRDKKSVNTRAALVHVMGDLLGSVAALIAGIVIQLTGWMPIDAILSILVSLLILKSTISILRESYHFLMEGVPLHIDYLQVGNDLKNVPGVLAVHDLHVWEMTPSFPALIGHIEIDQMSEWPEIMARINEMLLSKHGIDHVTLQPEIAGMVDEHTHDEQLHDEIKKPNVIHYGDSFFVTCASPDGPHRMAYHAWGNPSNPKVLVCVHGLTRRGSDFKTLAQAMSNDYYVVCPDVVGRGDSDRLKNPMLYAVPQYVADMASLIQHLGVAQVDWFGTSMGGLIGMVYASMPKNPIRRMLINDVGPRIEPEAIKRLGSYVGQPFSFANRADALQRLNEICASFGSHTPEEWEIYNGPMLVQKDGLWVMHYDPDISVPFASVNPIMAKAGEMAMWHAFKQIHVPMLIVRGGESDLLSAKTVAEMCKVNPYIRSIEIPGVGHAPAFVKSEQVALAKEFFS